MTIRALVFDLAGVLLDFGGPESLHKLSDGRVGNDEFFRFDVPPQDILFFDDSVTCVNGAIAAGMHAHHVTGFAELEWRLIQLGISGDDYSSA